MILDTFFGQLKSIVSFKENGDTKLLEIQETFAEVMMNVIGTKDLYEAWENMYHDSIDGYKTSEGEVTKAEKSDWIVKLPQILYIQLNRLKFEKGEALKILDPLLIEKTIYIDRFLV